MTLDVYVFMKCIYLLSNLSLDGCANGQVRCEEPNGKCIMSEWLCDGWADCKSGWDERNCGMSHTSSSLFTFLLLIFSSPFPLSSSTICSLFSVPYSHCNTYSYILKLLTCFCSTEIVCVKDCRKTILMLTPWF